MNDAIVARRYAAALFSLGKKQGEAAMDSYGQSLAELAEMLSSEPKLGQLLRSPVIGPDEKKAVLGALLDRMSAAPAMRNFCFLLADKERLGSLASIADWYGIMLDEAHGVLRGKVITAIKLSPERQVKLKEDLQKKIGKDMELVFSVDPEILGGMILAVGDRVLDSSLRAQLGAMRENLRRGM